MRLFTAITLPLDVKKQLSETSSIIERKVFKGNFSYYENYHITMVFLGDQEEEKLPIINNILLNTAEIFPPLYLECGNLDYFEKNNRKILYYEVNSSNAVLSKMQEYMYNEFVALELCTKQQHYVPHITIARNVRCDELPEFEQSIPFFSDGITLMHSTRINDRLTYLPIFSAPFNGLFTIDRIEENFAVCEGHNGMFFDINIEYLPFGISSGSKIRYNGLEYKIEEDNSRNDTSLKSRLKK